MLVHMPTSHLPENLITQTQSGLIKKRSLINALITPTWVIKYPSTEANNVFQNF